MSSLMNPWQPDRFDRQAAHVHYYSSEGLDEWYDYSADEESDDD